MLIRGEFFLPPVDCKGWPHRCSATLPPMTTTKTKTASNPATTPATAQSNPTATHLRLKEGINIYRTPVGLRCGTARSSFAIPEKGYVRALEILSANTWPDCDLATETGMNAEQVRELLWNLEEHEFLETTPSVLAVTTRYQSVAQHKRRDILPDASIAQLHNRVIPELSFTRLLDGVHDSGAAIINARQNARVEIYGSNRIATLLYGILLSSGVTYTHFALGTRSHDPQIIDSDLTAGFIRSTDVGLSFKQRTEDLGKELSLFPIESHENAQDLDGQPPERFIKVHVGALDSQLISQWMAAEQEHLLVSPPDGGKLLIGPFVNPGKTPCIRCRDITLRNSHSESSQSLAHVIGEKFTIGGKSIENEVPVFVAHYCAGLIASFILQRIDQDTCDLTGAFVEVDSLNLASSAPIPIDRNPACGCNWR